VQVHASHHSGHQMPQVQGRRICAPRNFTRTRCRPHFLRMQPLSRLRFHHAARAAQRAVPEMQRAIHRRKAHQARKFPQLHQGRLRLGNRSARAARRRNRDNRSSAARLNIRVARRQFRAPTRTRDRRRPRQILTVAQPLRAAHSITRRPSTCELSCRSSASCEARKNYTENNESRCEQIAFGQLSRILWTQRRVSVRLPGPLLACRFQLRMHRFSLRPALLLWRRPRQRA
jgi:hypothetical protein